jgi:AAA15 family ATPase/GTPase
MRYFKKRAKGVIINFTIANYKSVKDELMINFNAASIAEHQETNVIESDKLKLVRTILLYGPNASGKSKILEALIFLRHFVLSSAVDRPINQPIEVEPFELSPATAQKPSLFEVFFLLGKTKYRYGFEADKERVHKEWLFEATIEKEYDLFIRVNDKFKINSKRFPNAKSLEKRTRKNALFLSVAAQWNVQKASDISNWFENICTVHGLQDEHYRDITLKLMKDKATADLINRFMQKADLGINSVGTVEVPAAPQDSDLSKGSSAEVSSAAVYAVHNVYDRYKVVNTIPFFLDKSESEGTKKYFNMIGILITAIREGRLVVIDEFDARLHPLLSKALIRFFNSPETASHAQLLAASHDTALLDKDLLRRDQIYFIEKNQFGATHATALVEFKSRKEEPYYKKYLDGRYGAIPIIENLGALLSHG